MQNVSMGLFDNFLNNCTGCHKNSLMWHWSIGLELIVTITQGTMPQFFQNVFCFCHMRPHLRSWHLLHHQLVISPWSILNLGNNFWFMWLILLWVRLWKAWIKEEKQLWRKNTMKSTGIGKHMKALFLHLWKTNKQTQWLLSHCF